MLSEFTCSLTTLCTQKKKPKTKQINKKTNQKNQPKNSHPNIALHKLLEQNKTQTSQGITGPTVKHSGQFNVPTIHTQAHREVCKLYDSKPHKLNHNIQWSCFFFFSKYKRQKEPLITCNCQLRSSSDNKESIFQLTSVISNVILSNFPNDKSVLFKHNT